MLKHIVYSNIKELKKFAKLASSLAREETSRPSKYPKLPEELIQKWDEEQTLLKKKLILNDVEEWQHILNIEKKIFKLEELNDVDLNEHFKTHIRYIGGLDLSYIKEKEDIACAGLVILDCADNLKVVYEDIDMVNISHPYVPGYLAFREVSFLVEKLNNLKLKHPELYPQCCFIDGNGLLHQKRFGIASHLGVLTDTPTIGIAKHLYQVEGLENSQEFKNEIKEKLKNKGDYIELKSNNETKDLIGLCYRSASENPIYISIGHKISWKTCLLLLNLIITKYRIPEPTRIADILTREYIRINFPGNKNEQNSSSTS